MGTLALKLPGMGRGGLNPPSLGVPGNCESLSLLKLCPVLTLTPCAQILSPPSPLLSPSQGTTATWGGWVNMGTQRREPLGVAGVRILTHSGTSIGVLSWTPHDSPPSSGLFKLCFLLCTSLPNPLPVGGAWLKGHKQEEKESNQGGSWHPCLCHSQ